MTFSYIYIFLDLPLALRFVMCREGLESLVLKFDKTILSLLLKSVWKRMEGFLSYIGLFSLSVEAFCYAEEGWNR